jgi:O-antigen/teichoic acid export membrane protein
MRLSLPTINILNAAYACCPDGLHPILDRVKNSEIGSRLARGTFWLITGTVISRVPMLAASVLVARMLGKSGYGELGMIQSTVSMFGIFAGFGLGITATKYVAEFRHIDLARAQRIIDLLGMVAIIAGSLMALFVLGFAPWLAEYTINAPQLTGALRISALTLFITALNGAQTGALAGFEAFKAISYVNIFVGLVSFPVLIGGTYLGGLSGSVWALAINLGINWLLNHLALRKILPKHSISYALKDYRSELSILWRFTLPAILAGSLVTPVDWLCRALLVNRPNGYSEMGIYSVANQWYGLLLILPSLFSQVVLPVFSERLSENETQQSMKTMVFVIKLNLLLVIPLSVLASIASPYIMSIYGKDFRDGWPTLVVVVLTAGLLAVQSPVAQIIVASGKMWIGLAMNVGWATMFILSALLLVENGSLGLAVARASGYALLTIWTIGFAIYLAKKNSVSN